MSLNCCRCDSLLYHALCPHQNDDNNHQQQDDNIVRIFNTHRIRDRIEYLRCTLSVPRRMPR